MAAASAGSINGLTNYLPLEILEYILIHLNPSDLYSFMYSCKAHKELVISLLNIFTKHYSQNLPDFFSKNVWIMYSKLKYNHPDRYIPKMKAIRFKQILNAFNFASTNKYELIYDKCTRKHIESGRTPVMPYYVRISEIKLRYGLMYTFFNLNIYKSGERTVLSQDEFDHQLLTLVNRLSSIQFLFFMTILKNCPSIINLITTRYGVCDLMEFLKRPSEARFNEIKKFFNLTIIYGGIFENLISVYTHHGNQGCLRYIYALMYGFTERDAHSFATNRRLIGTTIEQLQTFKALIPIIGYKFAKHFIIDVPYNLEQYPHFLPVVSKYYLMGYVCVHKCAKLLADPSEENMGKLKAKRRRLE